MNDADRRHTVNRNGSERRYSNREAARSSSYDAHSAQKKADSYASSSVSYRTTRRQTVSASDDDTAARTGTRRSGSQAGNRPRSGSQRTRTSRSHDGARTRSGSASGARRRSGAQASTRGRSSSSHQITPALAVIGSSSNPWRNRIILIAIAVVLLLLVVGLVRCAVGGGEGRDVQSSAASSQASASSAQASATSPQPTTIVAQTAAAAAERRAAAMPAAPVVPADTGVEDRWVEGGRFTTGDAELDQWVKEICDGYTDPSLSQSENAYKAYCETMWWEYSERDNNQTPGGADWDIVYAKQFVQGGGGNCYEQVAIAEFVLKYFGYYDATAEPCYVMRQSGDYGDHGLVFVTDLDGRKRMCDPAFGSNGWMLDPNSYTMQVINIGQDPAEFSIAPFEKVADPYWV